MDASALLWKHWHKQVKDLFGKMHGHQQKTLAFFVMGIVLSGTAVLQRMAERLSEHGISEANMPSIERRLARFIANDRIVVEDVWKQFVAQVLPFWRDKKLRLVLDLTPFNDTATIVYVGLLVHSRLLPVAWCTMPAKTKWPEGQWSIVERLLDAIIPYVGKAQCTLIADRGLAGAPLVRICRQRGWHYLLRVCQEHTCRRKLGRTFCRTWSRFDTFIRQPGDRWSGRALVWQEEPLETNLSAYWDPLYEEAWLLISDLPAGRARSAEYALRMRVEATFQDQKSRGWNLEASGITDLTRLDRLLLGLFLAMWWVCHLAASCIHHGGRHRFDRHDRRDKGIFRLGRLWLLNILRRAPNVGAVCSCLPFTRRKNAWTFSLRF
jgi:Transposase DDE domain